MLLTIPHDLCKVSEAVRGQAVSFKGQEMGSVKSSSATFLLSFYLSLFILIERKRENPKQALHCQCGA